MRSDCCSVCQSSAVEDGEISQQAFVIRMDSGKLYVSEVRILILAYYLVATNKNAALRSCRQADAFVAKCF